MSVHITFELYVCFLQHRETVIKNKIVASISCREVLPWPAAAEAAPAVAAAAAAVGAAAGWSRSRC